MACLRRAWATARLLEHTHVLAEDSEIIRLANSWGAVQTYYVLYGAAQALVVAEGGTRPQSHEPTKRGRVMCRQDRADAVDREMAARLLPADALQALGRWWSGNAAEFADGTPGAHTVRYAPQPVSVSRAWAAPISIRTFCTAPARVLASWAACSTGRRARALVSAARARLWSPSAVCRGRSAVASLCGRGRAGR